MHERDFTRVFHEFGGRNFAADPNMSATVLCNDVDSFPFRIRQWLKATRRRLRNYEHTALRQLGWVEEHRRTRRNCDRVGLEQIRARFGNQCSERERLEISFGDYHKVSLVHVPGQHGCQ
jgi:hypothetical protein